MKPKRYTIIAFTENKPGVLYRLADLFLRRKVNIESLIVSEINPAEHVSRFVIEVTLDHARVTTIVRQMERIIEVLRVDLVPGHVEVTEGEGVAVQKI